MLARAQIRERVAQARTDIALWKPAPYDPDKINQFPKFHSGGIVGRNQIWEADDPLLRPRAWFR